MKKYLLQKERDNVNASQKSQPSSAVNSDSSKSPPLTVGISEHEERNVTSTQQPKSPTVTLAPTPPVLFMPVVPPLLVLQNQYFGIDAQAYADKGLAALSRSISPHTATGFPRLPEPRLGHPESLFAPAGFPGFNRHALSTNAGAYGAADECRAAVERSCATARPTFEGPSLQPPGQSWLQFGKYLSPYQATSIGRPIATGIVDESTADSSCLSNPAEDSSESLKDAVSEDSRNEGLDGGRGGSYSEELRGSLYMGSYSGDSATGHSTDSPGSHSGLDMFKSPASMRSVGRSRGPKLSRNSGEGSAGGGGSSRIPKPSGESHSGGRSIIRCPICGKLFNNSSALAKHKLTHSDERKYTCPKCSKAFKRQDHLNGHMMTHSSKKPFECKFVGCTKSYCDARSLRRHLENHHQDYINAATAFASLTDGTERLADNDSLDGSSVAVAAAACGSADISPSDGHLQRSSEGRRSAEGRQRSLSPFGVRQIWTTGYNPLDEPKPVKCHICDRGFKNIAALNGHMRLHGGYVRKDTNDADSEAVETGRHSAASVSTERSSSDRHSAVSLSSLSDDAKPKSAADNRYPFLLKTSTPSSSASMIGLEKTDPRASPHDAMISNLRSEIARSFPRQFWPPLQEPAGSGRLGVVGGGSSSGESRTEYESPIRWPELWPIVGRSQSEIPALQFGRKREESDPVVAAVAAFPRRSLPSEDRNVKSWQNEIDAANRVFKPWTTPSPVLEYGRAHRGGINEQSPPRRKSRQEEEMETRASSSNGARNAEEFRRGLQEMESRKNYSIVSGGPTGTMGQLHRTDIAATGLPSVEMTGIWTKVEYSRLPAKMEEDAPSTRGNPAELSKKGNRTGAVEELKRSTPPSLKVPTPSQNVSNLLEPQNYQNNGQCEERTSFVNAGIVIKSEVQNQQVALGESFPSSEKVIRFSPLRLSASPQYGKSSNGPLSTEKDTSAGMDTTTDEPSGKEAFSANLPTKSAATSGCENEISSPTESGHEFCVPDTPSSSSAEQWESLYRRRVKALLLKQGASLAGGDSAEDTALKSPRLGGQFVAIFSQNGSAEQQSPESDASDGEADSGSNAVVDVGSSEAECRTPVLSSQPEKIASVHCCSGSPHQVENTVSEEKNESLLSISKGNVIKSKSATNLLHDSYFHQCSGAENNHFACHVRDCGSMHCPSTPLAHHCCADAAAAGAHCVTPSCCYPSAKYPTCIAMDLASRCCMTPTARCASVSHCPGSCVHMASHPSTPSCLEVVSACKRHSASPCGTPCAAKCRCSAAGGGLLTPSCAGSCKRAAGLCVTPRGLNQPVELPPHTPCMAHTPCAPRESLSPRQATEPHTPCEPCTPQDGPHCAAAHKHPCTPVAQSCHFQFPPRIPHCETFVCRSPFIPYGRRFMSCHTPCASPLNLTIGHACAVHACPAAVQCCHSDQLQWQEQARCSCCTMNQLREDVLEIANRDRDFEQRRRLIEMEVEERMKNTAYQRSLESNQSCQVSGASPAAAVPQPRATTPPLIVEPDSTMANELSVDTADAEDAYRCQQRPQEDAVGTSENPETTEKPARQKSRDGKRVLVEEARCGDNIDLPQEKNGFDQKLKKLKRQWEDDYDVNVSRNSEKPADGVDTIKPKYSRQSEDIPAQVSSANRTSTLSSDLSQSLLERWQARQMESYLQDKTPLEILAEMGVDMRREALRQDAETEQPTGKAESVERFSEPETRKKRRPDPLVMTTSAAAASEDVNNSSYQSYLRSPRIWNGGDKIPYTPPPMLSPARHGSGLFWSVSRPSAAAGAPSSLRQQTAFSYSEQVNELPPATDVEPHINVGEQFQANLPSIIVSRASAVKQNDRADLLWRPDIATRPEAGPFDSIALPGGIPNREYAMQLLNLWHGDFKKAMLGLMQTSSQASQAGPVQPAGVTQSYSQRDNIEWQPDEIERFKTGVLQFNKDFTRISAHVGSRTAAECVQHYYAWKKSNVEEYRHLQVLRQRRHDDEAYRSRLASRGAAGYMPRDGQRSPVAE